MKSTANFLRTEAIDYLYGYSDYFPNVKRKNLEHWSICKHTMLDLIDLVREADSRSEEISAVEAYIRKMDDYACRKAANSWIFSISYDVAFHVLDILITLSERQNDE